MSKELDLSPTPWAILDEPWKPVSVVDKDGKQVLAARDRKRPDGTNAAYDNALAAMAGPQLYVFVKHFVDWWDEWHNATHPTKVESPDIESARALIAVLERV